MSILSCDENGRAHIAKVVNQDVKVVNMGAGKPLKARVLERLESGGAVVEVPVITETAELDLRRTHGGGEGKVSITGEHLRQMASNFGAWPKPVTVGFDGIDPGHDRDTGGPSSAFVESLTVRGTALWATVTLSGMLAGLIIEGAYRASSMEARLNPKTPTAEFEGWVLTGFIFTNNPATDTTFKIAATGEIESAEMGTASVPFDKPGLSEAKKESAMDPITAASEKAGKSESVSLTFHNEKVEGVKAQLTASEERVRTLSETNETLREQVVNLRADYDAARAKADTAKDEAATEKATASRAVSEARNLRDSNRQLQEQIVELTAKVNEVDAANLSLKVTDTITETIKAGVRPAVFEGHESNAADWMRAKFTSFEEFEKHCKVLAGGVTVPSGSQANSGHDPSTDGDPADGKEDLASADLTQATTEEEARKILAARKANEAAE